jgi:hypothetical protein
MYIAFYLDVEFYSGEVDPKEKDLETQFAVDLGRSLKFTVRMSGEGLWASDDVVSPDLVRAVGGEIERHDEGFETEPMKPGQYFLKLNEFGEIEHDPEGVQEQSNFE